jgi:hypothetical protein
VGSARACSFGITLCMPSWSIILMSRPSVCSSSRRVLPLIDRDVYIPSHSSLSDVSAPPLGAPSTPPQPMGARLARRRRASLVINPLRTVGRPGDGGGQLTLSPDQNASCLCTTRAGWALQHALIIRERRGGVENGAASDGAVRRETSPARDVLSRRRRHSTVRSHASLPFSSSLAVSPRTDIYYAGSGRDTHFPLH